MGQHINFRERPEKAEIKTKEMPKSLLVVRLVIASVIFAVSSAVSMPAAVKIILLALAALVAAYDGFDAADKLPESLKKRYDKMNGRLTKMSEATKNLTPALLVDAQRGVWAYGERKRGESFTITGIDKVIAVAEPAVNTLKTELVETEGYRDLQAHSQAKGLTMVDEFYHAVATRLAQDKYNVAEYRKQHMGENAELFLSEQEARFPASVGSLLAPVYMQENAEDNAETVYLSLCCAWMAYACEE